MSGEAIARESSFDATLPPIRLLAGEDGYRLLAEHPGTLRHVAYSLGVLAAGQPEPEPESWQPRAHKRLGEVLEVEMVDGEETYPGVDEFARMTVGLAYEKHDDYMAARTDSFGIPNRLAVFEELEYAMVWANERPQKAQRLEDGTVIPAEPRRGMGMGILDIDYFKDVNDVLGHPFGDKILLRISDHLQAIMRSGESGRRRGEDDRPSDAAVNPHPDWGLVGRLGGDEFAFALRVHEQKGLVSGRRGQQRLSLQEVFMRAAARIEDELAAELVVINQEIREERIRQNEERARLNLERTADEQLDLLPELPQLAASFGWEMAGRSDTEAKLVRKTDIAMYANKRAGKAADYEEDRRKLKTAERNQIGRVARVLSRPGFARYRRIIEPLVELYGQPL